jgi:uncharacterized protein YjbI with pentapeptide repeats
VAGGLTIVLLATWILDRVIHTSSKPADPIDITKLSFTLAGGVGAAVALVVAYRRQRDIEQGRFVERFGAAAAQLGDHDVAVRIAGVYAMAGVADESTGVRRQQCIDVLRGYLRLPYSPELGSNHQSKLVLTEHRIGDDGSPLGQQERHLEYRQNDKEVRATIVRVIADHLRDHEYSWSACDFDFRTAHLEDASFSRAAFDGFARFDAVTFSGRAWFDRATFFRPAVFTGAAFSSRAWFDGATFFQAVFERATFSHSTWSKATFSGPAQFNQATFSGDAEFREATFSISAEFGKARFSGEADFGKATFSLGAQFNQATFSGKARFGEATFSGRTEFGEATFSGDADFGHATFSGGARFNEAAFSGFTSFAGSDFGRGAVSFENPRRWGLLMLFDWGADLSAKPKNVEPQNWPPTPIGTTDMPE